jgi:fructosamine-3-kinase
MTASPADRIEAATGLRPLRLAPLSGGCVGEVWRVAMPGGTTLVAKTAENGGALCVEGWMLGYLARHSALPVPKVIHAEDRLLLMEHIDAGDPIGDDAERHAAELLAALHAIDAPSFGLERDTPIGGLLQPNGDLPGWLDFFRDRRLLPMARAARDAGRLPAATTRRIDRLAARLSGWIGDDVRPALIHGDMWSGNVLVKRGRIAGFIDPAIYYADPEIELAFATLFGTFGGAFFDRYGEIRPLRPGFFEIRRDLYNLYPLLVHVRLFGGSYVAGVARILDRLGA